MLSEETRKRVEKATVRLTEKGGQGVIVPGGFILTAAHCIEASYNGEMPLGDLFLEKIECDGQHIVASVHAVEPVSDIAVLGAPDNQSCAEEAMAYERVIDLIEPIEIRSKDLALFQEIPAMVFTHKRSWLNATVQNCRGNAPTLCILGAAIEGGASGGPVIDQEGRLLGIVSLGGYGGSRLDGQISRPLLALPVWVVDEITREGRREE